MPQSPAFDAYQVVAQVIFLCAALGACAWGLVRGGLLAARDWRQVTTRRLGIWVGVLVAAQVLASALGVGLALAGVVAWGTGLLAAGGFVLLLPALLVLPAGLARDSERHLPGEGNSARRRLVITAVTIACIVGSLGYLLAVSQFVTLEVDSSLEALMQDKLALFVFLPVALIAAPVEEIIFRQGIQQPLIDRLGGSPLAAWGCIAFTALIWAVGHSAYVTPHGIKEAQIFLVGLGFGWLHWRYGLVACTAAHLGLNGSMLALEIVNRLLPGGEVPVV